MKHRNSLYYHGKEEHGVHLSARSTCTMDTPKNGHNSTPQRQVQSLDTSSNEEASTSRAIQRESIIPAPTGKHHLDSRRAVISSASHSSANINDQATTSTIQYTAHPIVPRATLEHNSTKDLPDPVDEVWEAIALVERDEQVINEQDITSLSTNLQPTTPRQPPDLQLIKPTMKPWQNSQAIEAFARKLLHKKYQSIEAIIEDNNFGNLDNREKDLLAVMWTLSNATLTMITDEHHKLITDAVTRDLNPSTMQLIADLGRLTKRMQR